MENEGLYESCNKKLLELADYYDQNKADRNEATTRLHLINELLYNCLGWDKGDIIAEDHQDQEYADYTIKLHRPIALLEAKREGKYFELPIYPNKKKRYYQIESITKGNEDLNAAVDQVLGYCTKRGVEVGVICNGWQLVAFIASRNDGIPPKDGLALVFDSLQNMKEGFLDLWNCLSKPGIKEKYLHAKLIGKEIIELPPKLSSTICGYPGIKGRNIFQTNLQILSEIVLEDVISNPDLEAQFLEECYCKSGALSQYAIVSKEILKARYSYLFDKDIDKPVVLPAVGRKGVSSELVADSLTRRPVLLIGDVGVGKTSFIKYLRKVEGQKLFDNAITFYIDLGSQAIITSDIRKFILKEIVRQLLDNFDIDVYQDNFVKAVYQIDLQRFRKGVYQHYFETNNPIAKEKEIEFLNDKSSDISSHIKQSLEHISKGRMKQIVAFIDNTDQRNEEAQQTAFLISQEFAEHWPVAVFLALRPETFHRSSKSGALSGYHPKAFTISPPRVEEVLLKRLEFACKIAQGIIPLQKLKQGVGINVDSLNILLEVLIISLEKNRNLFEFIANIAGGNIRQALDIVKGFVGSGHINTKKIVDICKEEERQYIIPLHEFQRAVIYGDSEHYDPNSSPIVNLFDVSLYDPKEHFLLPIILGFCESALKSNVNSGFIETDKIYGHVQSLGFTIEQIDNALIKAQKKRLVESSARGVPITGELLPQAIRITTIGAYHMLKLITEFVMIDAVCEDTPIFDRKYRDYITNCRYIKDRLERAKFFIEYLNNKWKPLEDKETYFSWPETRQSIEKNIQGISNRIRY